MIKHAMIGTVSSLALLAYAAPAFAQPAETTDQPAAAQPAQVTDDTTSGDIVVTARRQSETLLSVPVSVTAVTGQRLDDYHVTDLRTLTRQTTGVTIDTAPVAVRLAVRGMSSPASNASIDPNVGLGQDEIFLTTLKWLYIPQFDVGQVEILKGPQVTYFGKNATAGQVNITTRGPTATPDGYVDVGYEAGIRGKFAEFAYGGPISDTLQARLAVKGRTTGGFLDHDLYGKGPDTDEIVARVGTKWMPTSNLTIDARAQYAKFKEKGTRLELASCSPTLIASLTAAGSTADCKWNRKHLDDRGSLPGSFTPYDRSRDSYTSYLGSVKADWDLGPVTLSSVTGWWKITERRFVNLSFSPITLFDFVRDPEVQKQFSQEFRLAAKDLGPIDLNIGLYYSRMTTDDSLYQGYNTLTAGLPFAFAASRYKDYYQVNNTYAIYGEATWNIMDSLRIIGGGRYTIDRKSANEQSYVGTVGNPFDANPAAVTAAATFVGAGPFNVADKRKTTNFSPTVTGQWDFMPNGQFYVAYKEGFKAGGFDSGLANASTAAAAFEFEDEKVRSFEAGVKFRTADRKLTFTAAVFDTKFKNLQLTAIQPPYSGIVLNAGSAKSTGAEADLTFRVMQGVTLNAGATYADTHFVSFVGAPCFAGQTVAQGCVGGSQNVDGKLLPMASKWQVQGGIDVVRPINDDFVLSVGASVNYRTKQWLQTDYNVNSIQKGYALLDARIAVATTDNKWEFSVIGKNLTDKLYAVGGLGVPFFGATSIMKANGDPRIVVFSIKRNLGS
jgi:outer membrane receptor protein involved in Fe transport